MKPEIVEIIRAVEQYTATTEIDLYTPISYIRRNNEAKLLEGLKPYSKTQVFKRHMEDPGYLESRIWLPYIKDEIVEKLKKGLKAKTEYNNNLQERIDDYNSFSWWRKLYSDV